MKKYGTYILYNQFYVWVVNKLLDITNYIQPNNQ